VGYVNLPPLSYLLSRPIAFQEEAALYRFAFVLFLAFAAASCTPSGPPVKGVAETSDWFSLPLNQALEERQTRPEAISACNTAECPQRIAVAFMTARGREADRLELLLRKPSVLLEEMRHRKDMAQNRGKQPGAATSPGTMAIVPFVHNGLDGFAVTMNRQDGSHAVAGAALGWRNGHALSVVIGIGENKDMVMTAVTKAADQYRENSD